jgi:hypothetical protein
MTGVVLLDSIDHPSGAHDDVANAVAGVAAIVEERRQPGSGSMELIEFHRRLNRENYRYDPSTGRTRYAPPTVPTPWG